MEAKAGTKKIGDFILGKTIGQGTFGKVKQGIHMPSGHKVAIKILQKDRINIREDLARVHNELKILYKKVDHPNIIKLLELHESPTHVYIVTEFIEGKELYELIVEKGSLDPHLCGIYFCQLVQAIQYLHSIGICHRDIKPENIMVNGESLKLIDFGLSKQFGPDRLLKTSCGSPCYAAPEMLTGRHYDCVKSDIWAMGVTLYAMAAGHLPYEDENTDRLYELIEVSTFEPIVAMSQNHLFQQPVALSSSPSPLCPYILSHPTSISLINLLLEKVLRNNPGQRISLEEMNENIWVKQWQSYLRRSQIGYENDEILLNSMSEYFQKTVTQIRDILKNKSIMSICTYYFLNRRKKSYSNARFNQLSDHELDNRQKIQAGFVREQNKLIGTPAKQVNSQSNNRNNPESSTKKVCKRDERSNNQHIQTGEKLQVYSDFKPAGQTDLCLVPQIHYGSFHLDLVFSNLQDVYMYVNTELRTKPQTFNNKIDEEDQDQGQDQDQDQSGNQKEEEDSYKPIWKYHESNRLETEWGCQQQQMPWKNKYVVGREKKRPTLGVVKGGGKLKRRENVVWVDKYTVEVEGVEVKIKVLQNSRMLYLDVPAYFVS